MTTREQVDRSPEARLQQLAIEGAQWRHMNCGCNIEGPWPRAGHTHDFATCPHPDCTLVREALLTEDAVTRPAQSRMDEVAEWDIYRDSDDVRHFVADVKGKPVAARSEALNEEE